MGIFSMRRPTNGELDQVLERLRSAAFSYDEVGVTLDGRALPAGVVVDRNRVELGHGAEVFEAACRALRRWTMFRLGWVEAYPESTPIEKGQVVLVVAKTLGFWTRNASRIIDVVASESDGVKTYGFAYGTLSEHVESGEERFLIEWSSVDDSVTYDIFAFSKPKAWLVRLGYPFARVVQRRFGRDSKRAMLAAVAV
jgi:uncharacterized protein (UPF0548 family)